MVALQELLLIEKQVTAQQKVVMGAMKVVYWLAKEEVAHSTKYESLLDLAISLGSIHIYLP